MEDNEAYSLGFILGYLIALSIGSIILGLILKLAVLTYNTLAGGAESKSGISKTSTALTIKISIFATLINIAMEMAVNSAFPKQLDGAPRIYNKQAIFLELGVRLIQLFFMIIFYIYLIKNILKTTTFRALLVTLCYIFIMVIFGLVAAGVTVGAMFAMR
jgi:hypothetical protein